MNGGRVLNAFGGRNDGEEESIKRIFVSLKIVSPITNGKLPLGW